MLADHAVSMAPLDCRAEKISERITSRIELKTAMAGARPMVSHPSLCLMKPCIRSDSLTVRFLQRGRPATVVFTCRIRKYNLSRKDKLESDIRSATRLPLVFVEQETTPSPLRESHVALTETCGTSIRSI